MTYEIAYAPENENMCEIKRVVIPIHSRTLKRLKMSYCTNKPSVYHEGKFIVRNYTEDQAGLDIRKEDVVQARNGWYYTSQEIETWKVKNTQDLPMYGNCVRCGKGRPIGTECSQCKEWPLMEGGVATGTVRQIYRLYQVEDMFFDSCLIAEIHGKGHDVAKADTWHRPGELVRDLNIIPLNKLYIRLNGERDGEYWSKDEDFSDIAVNMQMLMK